MLGIISAQIILITRKINQNNGKEKGDHQIKWNDGKENVFKHIFQGYILPKGKQSMISMTGYNVENPLGKGGEIS